MKKASSQSALRTVSGGPPNLVAFLNELAVLVKASRVQNSADISVSTSPDGTILTIRPQGPSGNGSSSSGGLIGIQFSFTSGTPPVASDIAAGIIIAFGSTGNAAIFGTLLVSTQAHYYVFPKTAVTFTANGVFVISLTLTSGQACWAVCIGGFARWY